MGNHDSNIVDAALGERLATSGLDPQRTLKL